MGYRKRLLSPTLALAVALLTIGGGCATDDATKSTSKKLDVLKPGVLPPPQETLNASPTPAVVPAGGTTAAPIAPSGPPPVAAAAPATSGLTMPKINLHPSEKKVPATQIAVAWRSNIDYLPDPTRNGAMGAGLAGQLFMFGGPKLEFAQPDGVLTVDLIDESPRPPGQPAATPERWQFNKEMLRNLRTSNETWGKSYVLFLPWPAYRADITRVKISVRYDPDNGPYPLFVPPTTVSLSPDAPKIEHSSSTTTAVVAPGLRAQAFDTSGTLPSSGAPLGNFAPPSPQPPSNFGNPIPLGGSASGTAPSGAFQQNPMPAQLPAPGGAVDAPPGTAPVGALQPNPMPVPPSAPGTPVGAMVVPPAPASPVGAMVVPPVSVSAPAPGGPLGAMVVPPVSVPPASGGSVGAMVVPPVTTGVVPMAPTADPQQIPIFAPR